MVNFFAPKITRQNSLSVHIQRLYSTPTEVTIARLAQSVEHETLNLRVVGSSPTLGVQIFFFSIGAHNTMKTQNVLIYGTLIYRLFQYIKMLTYSIQPSVKSMLQALVITTT